MRRRFRKRCSKEINKWLHETHVHTLLSSLAFTSTCFFTRAGWTRPPLRTLPPYVKAIDSVPPKDQQQGQHTEFQLLRGGVVGGEVNHHLDLPPTWKVVPSCRQLGFGWLSRLRWPLGEAGTEPCAASSGTSGTRPMRGLRRTAQATSSRVSVTPHLARLIAVADGIVNTGTCDPLEAG